MSSVVLYWGSFFSQLMLVIAAILALFRVVFGPQAHDRVMGFDTFYMTVMMLFVTFGIRAGTELYFEIAFVIAMLGFVSSIAFAKFLMRGEVIE